MKIKLVKYWKIELFEQSKDKSVISNMMNEPKRPFFTGYSKEPIKPHKLQGGDFISLATSPDFIETKSVRTYRLMNLNVRRFMRTTTLFRKQLNR
ncbi:hypothetical protein CFQ87_11720 [Salmonella enterica subsp. enterica serovar Javiana]|nr:hypothetical protein [Salmonella enterica]ECT9263023.1 hypothetical protein [Salmonella enterica subsp. enterica serovar Javiana]